MKFFGFNGGIHPPENKIQTESLAVENLLAPELLYIPMLQIIGTPLSPIVEIGDKVLKGQKIAESKEFMSSPIHSPVSGTVTKIENNVSPTGGKVKTIFIENDGENKYADLTKIENWETATNEELLDMIKEKGVVGIGGACFPTHIKLNPPKDATVDTLLLNAAECEPYLNTDNRLMLEKASDIINGIKIMKKILNVQSAIIGIEDNKPEAISIMKEAVKGTDIEVMSLETKYPQGGEKQLIKAVLNRVVPSGGLPFSVGVVVQNIGTAAAVYDAIVNGMPLIEKTITVSGEAIKSPKNLRVPIGTPFSCILDYCDVDREKMNKLIMGGPMMGVSQSSELVPVIKATSGVLALTNPEMNTCDTRACISCGKCVDVCPMKLEPVMYDRIAISKQWDAMEEFNVLDCIECGSCSFVCPSNRPLAKAIKDGKTKLRAQLKKRNN